LLLKNSTNISAAWLPFLSFLLVMIGVIVLVRLGARLIQSAMEMVLLGWLNKLTGVVLYAALYITIFSVLLFYAEKIHWLKPETFTASHTYAFIQPWGPKAIDLFGAVIPFFKGMFEHLSQFFDKIHAQVK
jgi:membrane protein required for colicin V production